MDIYEVTPAGRLVRKWMGDEAGRPLGDMNFSGMLKIRSSEKYSLALVDGALAAIQCESLPSRLIFDPSECIES